MNRFHIAASVLLLGLVGSSVSIWYVRADDEPKGTSIKLKKVKTLAETTAVLQERCKIEQNLVGMSLDEFFTSLEKDHGVRFRLDPACFNKNSGHAAVLEHKLPHFAPYNLPIGDVLQVVCSDLSGGEDNFKAGVRAKAGQIIIGRAHVPATTPGQYKTGQVQINIPEDAVNALLVGPTVSIAMENQSLAEMVHQLREQTGANIVLDPRVNALAEKKLTLTFNDAKLMTVLKLAANLCDVGVAVVDNAYVVTEPGMAEALMTETELNLFGEPPAKRKK